MPDVPPTSLREAMKREDVIRIVRAFVPVDDADVIEATIESWHTRRDKAERDKATAVAAARAALLGEATATIKALRTDKRYEPTKQRILAALAALATPHTGV